MSQRGWKSLWSSGHDARALLSADDPNWYRVLYSQAVGYVILAQARPRPGAAQRQSDIRGFRSIEQGRACAVEVSIELESRLLAGYRDKIGTSGPGEQSTAELRPFLMALEPTILLLLAGILRRWGWREGARQPRHGHGRDDYGEPEHEVSQMAILEGLRHESLNWQHVVSYVTTLNLNYRARYNLACFFAGLGDESRSEEREAYYEQAFSELAASLTAAPNDLAIWARRDPSLDGLRNDQQFAGQLEHLLEGLNEEGNIKRGARGSRSRRSR